MYRLRDDLEREWEALVTGPGGAAALRRWAAADGRLSGFDGLGELIALVRRPPSARTGNDVLGALLHLGGDDAFARRCLLQALMPCLVRLAGRYPSAGEDPDDRLQTVLVIAIERIHELAGEEIAWPAVAVGGYVRDRLRRAARTDRNPCLVAMEAAMAVPAGPERSAAERLAGVLVDGLRRGTIRRDEAALLYTTRVVGHPPATVAAALGIDPVALRTRRLRAEQRLAGQSMSVC
jgi:DNA-directed RNA polymerase specialized sigma24 family protein